jgi:rhamnosyltransferase
VNIQELHEELASNTIESARIGVVIPTLNASRIWGNLQRGLEQQGLHSSQILIIDSSSTDDTRSLAEQAGFVVIRIPRSEFSHGGTRELACRYLPWADFLVFMTQDAVLANDEALAQLCSALEDNTVGAAYGRQLPREEAGLIERHGRLFNYPPLSEVRSIENRRQLGFRAAFFSNSFAVYRRTALEQAGGFPSDAIVSEEVTVIARACFINISAV